MRMKPSHVALRKATGKGVADNWHDAYYTNYGNQWRPGKLTCGRTAKQVHEELSALGDNASLDAIEEVIGNKSWSYPACDGCGDNCDSVVAIGDESRALSYCKTCLEEALSLFEGGGS